MPATIVDWAGREITRSERPGTGRAIQPSKSAWYDSLATDITPANIIGYLNSADRGNMTQQMQLFDRMVDRDDRLQAVLETRKLAVTGVDRKIVPSIPEDPKAEKAADLCREMLMPLLEDPLSALLDGVPKGLAAQEIVWEGSTVVGLNEVPQRLFRWVGPESLEVDYSGGSGTADFRALEESKFVLFCPRNKPGSKERRGILRALSIMWVAKHWALRDLAAFVEVFGMPLRVGVYPENISDTQRTALYDALADLGSDSSAIIPENVRIEFPKIQQVSGQGTPMDQLISYVDRSYAIRVLGQNLTTEGVSGSGTLAGGAHENVRGDYKRSDARSVADTIKRDLFAPVVGYNLGWDYPVPDLWFDVEEAQDDEARVKVYTELAKIPGMKFSLSQIRREFAIDEPIDDEDAIEISGDDVGLLGLGDPAGTPASIAAGIEKAGDGVVTPGMAACESVAEDGWTQTQQLAIDGIMKWVNRLSEEVDTPEQLLRRIRLSGEDIDQQLEDAGLKIDDIADIVARSLVTGEYNGGGAVQNELDWQRDQGYVEDEE